MSDKKARPVPRYKSAGDRARATSFFLLATIFVYVFALVIHAQQFALVVQIEGGDAVSQAEVAALYDREATIGKLAGTLFVLTAIAFLMWVHRSHRNLSALGAQGLKFTPGWAVGWWFIPILNLFQPFRIIREIWRASDPSVAIGTAWRAAPSSPLIGWWWGLFLASVVYFQVSGDAPISLYLLTATVDIATDLFGVIAAVLAIRLVLRIEARQTARSRLPEVQPE